MTGDTRPETAWWLADDYRLQRNQARAERDAALAAVQRAEALAAEWDRQSNAHPGGRLNTGRAADTVRRALTGEDA